MGYAFTRQMGMLRGKFMVEWLEGEVLAMARSTIALLGPLRELYAALPGYDWRHLEQLVTDSTRCARRSGCCASGSGTIVAKAGGELVK